MTLKRALLVGAGIVTLIAGAFAFIEGIVFLFDGWWGSHWLLYGTLGIVAFAFSIASAVSHFRRRWFVVAIVGPSLLLVAGVVTLLAIGFLAIVVLVLSILALAFTVVGLSEFVRSGSDGSGGWPTAAPVGTGAAPPPEWYPAPPGAGAPPPPAGPLFPGDDEDPGRVS